MLIGGRSQRTAHEREAANKLRDRKFELADENTARCRDGKAKAVHAGRQRKGKIGNQQRFTHLGLFANKEDALRWQQSRFHQAGRRSRWLLFEQLRQGQHRRWGGLCRGGIAHSIASVVASSKIASPTVDSFREAARRSAVRASLLTLRRMPLVA